MKRFASHYLYIPSHGFLKQHVIEIDSNGYVTTLYPLKEEVESVIWIPGVIAFITAPLLQDVKERQWKGSNIIAFEQKDIKTELPVGFNNVDALKLTAVRLYPFDFTQMQPIESTGFQVLDNHSLY